MAVESESKMLIILDQAGDYWSYEITKFDLNPHFSSSRSCSNRSISQNRRHHLTLGRFRRFLRVRLRRRRHRPPLLLHKAPLSVRPPLIPEALSVPCLGNFKCALGAGFAVLGSKIYIIGGTVPSGGDHLHRGVYMIDASSDTPEMVKLSCELNFGKLSPIVCTIGSKIYVLPVSFNRGTVLRTHGQEFECFDPESNSCTVLPSPSGFEKIKIENLNCMRSDWSRVNSHAVVGSNLVISLDLGGGVFTFDTTRPDRGWRRIRILLVLENDEPPHLLNFLPFDHGCSFPIRDDLIFCSPRKNCNYDLELNPHIRRSFKLDISRRDSYVCSFHNVAQLSDPKCEFVKVSIHLVTGLDITKQKFKSEDDFEYMQFAKSSRTLGDGIVLVSKDGSDEYGFEIFQVGRAFNYHHFEASKISSARFKTRWIFDYMTPFVIKG